MTRREKPSWLPRTLVSCLTCGSAPAVSDAYDTSEADRGRLTGPAAHEVASGVSVLPADVQQGDQQDVRHAPEASALPLAAGPEDAAAAVAPAPLVAPAGGLQPAGSSTAVPPFLWEAATLLQPDAAVAVGGDAAHGNSPAEPAAAGLEPPTAMQLPRIHIKRPPAAQRKQQQQQAASPKPPLPGPSRRGLLMMQSEPVNALESPPSMSPPSRRLQHLQQQQQQPPPPMQLDFSFPSITSLPDQTLLRRQGMHRPASYGSGLDAPGRRTSFSSFTSDTLLDDVPLRLRPIRTPRYHTKDPSPPSPKALRSASYLLHGPSRDVIRRLNMSRFSGSFDLRRDQGQQQERGGESHGGSFDLPRPAGVNPPRRQQQGVVGQLDQGALEQRLSGVEAAAAAGGGGGAGLATQASGSSLSSRNRTSTEYGPTPDAAIPSDFFFPSDYQGSNASARGSGEQSRPLSMDAGGEPSSAAAVVAMGRAGFSQAGARPPSSDTLSATEGVFRMQTSEAGSSSHHSGSEGRNRQQQRHQQQQAAVSSPLTQQQLEQLDTDSMVAELASAAALFSRTGFTLPQLKPPHLVQQTQPYPLVGTMQQPIGHGLFPAPEQQQRQGGGAHALAPSGAAGDATGASDCLQMTPRAGMSSGFFVTTTSQAQGFSSPSQTAGQGFHSPPQTAGQGIMGAASGSSPQQRSPQSGRLSFDSASPAGEGVAGVAYARGFRRQQQQQQQQQSPRLSFDTHVVPSDDIAGVVYARSTRLASASNSNSSSPQAQGPGVSPEGPRASGGTASAARPSAVQCAADVLGVRGAGAPAAPAGSVGLRYATGIAGTDL